MPIVNAHKHCEISTFDSFHDAKICWKNFLSDTQRKFSPVLPLSDIERPSQGCRSSHTLPILYSSPQSLLPQARTYHAHDGHFASTPGGGSLDLAISVKGENPRIIFEELLQKILVALS